MMPEEKRKKTEFSFGKGRSRRRQQLRKARAAPRKQTGDSSAASVSDPVSPVSTPSIDSPGPSNTQQQSTVSLSPLLLTIYILQHVAYCRSIV